MFRRLPQLLRCGIISYKPVLNRIVHRHPKTTRKLSSRPVTFVMERPPELINTEGERTFQFDESRPALPLPRLEKTLEKYLESVRPHLTPEELKQTEKVVKEFGEGLGPELHGKLVEYAKEKKNWLDQWWHDKAYLEFRMPLAPSMNIAGTGPSSARYLPPREGSQIERAAYLTHIYLCFWQTLRREELRVDRDSSGTIFSMTQYRNLFNCFQEPGVTKDEIRSFFKTESEGDCPHHITVICRGRVFLLDVLHESGEMLTIPELQHQFQYIRDKCDELGDQFSIAPLTKEERTTWAKLRKYVQDLHPDNQRNLDILESSIWITTLEDGSPQTLDEMTSQAMIGNADNMWADKSVTASYHKNGTCTLNCGHGPFDGMAFIFGIHFCNRMIEINKGEYKGSQEVRDMAKPEELTFHTDEVIKSAVQEARTNYDKVVGDLDILAPTFLGYGKDWIRSHKLHPDAHVQLALQLAYYRQHGKPAPTYETGTIRHFYNGRTETVRSCTTEVITWAKAMLDPAVKDVEKRRLYDVAHEKHIRSMKEASQMEGCDRHLLGLSILAQEAGMPTPALYTDPAFVKSGGGGNFVLSTSFLGFTECFGGTTAMCHNGYGVFYAINPDRVQFFTTAWKSHPETSTELLADSLAQSLQDMQRIIESTRKHKL